MPIFDPAAIEKAIKVGSLGPVYLFYGEDARLVERLVDLIEATIDPADRPFAVERLYAAEAGGSPLDIAAAARVYPMLGDRRLVIVLRAERLLKPKRASAGKADDDGDEPAEAGESEAVDLAPLEEYLKDAPLGKTSLIFVATEIDRSRRLTKQLLAAAAVVECRGIVSKDDKGKTFFDRRLAERLAQAELTKAGRTIDAEGLALLVNAAGTEISKLQGDIGRLVLFTEGRPRIAYADVAEVVSADGGVVDDWAVVNALGDGNAALALREIGRRLDRGDSAHAVVGQLRWWVSSKLAADQPDRVKPALGALLRTDLALKSSGGDERVLLERLVVELTGRPVQKRW